MGKATLDMAGVRQPLIWQAGRILDVKGFEFNYVRPVTPFYTGSTNTVRATINASFPHLYAAASAVDDALDEFEGMHGTLPGAAAEDALLLKTPVAILNHLHQSTANLPARRTTMLQRLKSSSQRYRLCSTSR